MLWTIAVILLIRNHRVLARYRYVAMFTGIVLLLLPMLPVIGHEEFGAQLWIQIGSFSFQPGELAKLCLAIFFAIVWVSRRPGREKLARGLDNSAAGSTLRRAQSLLEEVAQFESE